VRHEVDGQDEIITTIPNKYKDQYGGLIFDISPGSLDFGPILGSKTNPVKVRLYLPGEKSFLRISRF
jgi:hypothetical protein